MKIWKRVLFGAGIAVVLLVVTTVVVLRSTGAWRVFFPVHTHETSPPEIPAGLGDGAVLIFTKTNSFRHIDAIDAGVPLLERLGAEHGLESFHTENGAVFNDEDLARFSVVIFHNASGDVLSEDQEASFRRFLENGGGWIGTHAAGDASHAEWGWYVDSMIGGNYTAHTMGPQFQEARLVVENPDHPATRKLPAEWNHVEEWYSWDASPRDAGFEVLVSVDESTYEPWQRLFGREQDLRMGDHPIVWTSCVGSGRIFYSALGHQGEAYDTQEVQDLLGGAIAWAARLDGEGCDGVAP